MSMIWFIACSRASAWLRRGALADWVTAISWERASEGSKLARQTPRGDPYGQACPPRQEHHFPPRARRRPSGDLWYELVPNIFLPVNAEVVLRRSAAEEGRSRNAGPEQCAR